MARPRSDDKRNAIIAAAVRVIISHGLSAPTALIAKEAGVSNGTLFVYFKTKAELFNQLYLELKTEMSSTLLEGMPTNESIRNQVHHMWLRWMAWARANPNSRRALALLAVYEEMTPETRAIAQQKMASLGELLEQCRSKGALKDSPMPFVAQIMTAVAESTMDFMIQDPKNADKHCEAGFEAIWRAIG